MIEECDGCSSDVAFLDKVIYGGVDLSGGESGFIEAGVDWGVLCDGQEGKNKRDLAEHWGIVRGRWRARGKGKTGPSSSTPIASRRVPKRSPQDDKDFRGAMRASSFVGKGV